MRYHSVIRVISGGLLFLALSANAATNTSADCFFNWMETTYPQYFAPAQAPSQTIDVYYYRYYSATNAYLALANTTRHMLYVGPLSGGAVVDFGDISSLLGVVGCPATPTIGARFPIASNWGLNDGAFDGTNFLVALQSDSQTASVAAQMLSSIGAKIGSVIATGRAGQSCCNAIAFDGANYLMIWEDDQGIKNSETSFMIYGQFISMSGVAMGQPFAITTAGIWQDGAKVLAYGGGKYLLTYTRLIIPANGYSPNNRYIAGRIISPDGTMGNEFRISTGFGAGSGMAFDGTNFFVVWEDHSQGYEVRGRFVSPSGNLGQEISINASTSLSSDFHLPVAVAFDGTNYLVAWNGAVGGQYELDIFGQRVSPNGTLVGDVITVVNEAGAQIAPTLAFAGANYLAVWTDAKNDRDNICDAGEGTCWDMHGQYIGKNGALVGGKIEIDTDAGNQIGGVMAVNGKYLVGVNTGMVVGPRGAPAQVGDVYGVVITP